MNSHTTFTNKIFIRIVILIFIIFNFSFADSIKCQPGIEGKSPKRIAWFAGSKGTGFWPMVEKLMRASAKDIGVSLEVYNTDSPLEYMNMLEKVINRKENKIDGIIFHNYKHRGVELLKKIDEKGIPTILFNAGFSSSSNVGKPREKYNCWIGSMLPNDEKAGYELTNALLLEAKKNSNMLHNNQIHMVALEGDRASNVSTLRMLGMKKALKDWTNNSNNPKVILHQSFHSKWRRDLASIAYKLTQSRYPKVSVFWTAADVMSLGVIDAAKEAGKIPNKDFVTGGMDLLPSTLKSLNEGNITASVGAHFIEGAFAIIALYDYLNGYDFAKVGTNEFLTKMAIKVGKTQQTLLIDEEFINKRLELIDFRLYSNSYKGETVPYKFNTQDILNKLWQ